MNIAKKDVRSTTGSNLRNILLLTNCLTVDDLNKRAVGDIMYNNIQEKDMWRVNFIKEIIDIKNDALVSPVGWSAEDLEEILTFACTQ